MTLREARKKKKMTMNKLGDLVGVKATTICAYEKGRRRPSIDVAKKLGKVLGIGWTKFYSDSQNAG